MSREEYSKGWDAELKQTLKIEHRRDSIIHFSICRESLMTTAELNKYFTAILDYTRNLDKKYPAIFDLTLVGEVSKVVIETLLALPKELERYEHMHVSDFVPILPETARCLHNLLKEHYEEDKKS